MMIKILVVDQNMRSGSDSKLLHLLSDKDYQCYFLNNTASLTDSMFLDSFDVVIIDLLNNNNIIHDFPKGEHKVILLVGVKETYLLPYVRSFHSIVKKENLHELNTAINVAMSGGCFMSQEIKETLFPKRRDSIDETIRGHTAEVLTKMEMCVAEELVSDKTNQEIANTLFMSKRTVEYHIASCIQKLNANSRVGLAIKIAKGNFFINRPSGVV